MVVEKDAIRSFVDVMGVVVVVVVIIVVVGLVVSADFVFMVVIGLILRDNVAEGAC